MNPKINRSSLDVTDTPPPVEQTSSQNYNSTRPTSRRFLQTRRPSAISASCSRRGAVARRRTQARWLGRAAQFPRRQSERCHGPGDREFGQTVPVDQIETVNVLNTPFWRSTGASAERGRGGNAPGGDTWHYDLNDPFPDFSIRSDHMRGIRNETPRASVGGPVIKDRLFVISALQYVMDKVPSRTLPFPYNVSKHERINSFTQIDYILSQRQIVNVTFHFNPEHTNFVNPNYFSPEEVSPSYAQHSYEGTVADHLGLWGGTLGHFIRLPALSHVYRSAGSFG